MPSSSSRIRLVVNADGFGASPERDRGVIETHRHGILTSTAILGNASDPGSIQRALAAMPNLGVGICLCLTGGAPVSPPDSVASLLEPTGSFPARTRDFLLLWAKAVLRAEHVEREFDAQVTRFSELGLRIDHLCTKDNLGFLPAVALAAQNIARRHGIPGLRTAVEKPTLAWTSDPRRGLATATLGAFAWLSRRQLGALRHGPQSWGYFENGRLDEVRILEILGRLRPGSHELICQPELAPHAPSVSARGEVEALASHRVREALDRRGIELCRWSDLF